MAKYLLLFITLFSFFIADYAMVDHEIILGVCPYCKGCHSPSLPCPKK